jgi:hypothetical protein
LPERSDQLCAIEKHFHSNVNEGDLHMNSRIDRPKRTLLMAIGAFALGAMLTTNAFAGCGDVLEKSGNPQQKTLKPIAYFQSGGSGDNSPGGADIVGMWKFTFLSKNSPGIPDGITIDWGFTQWHSDGTEITNSATRAPATQNFCLGVWKKAGPSTYRLNHQALSYDPNGNLMGVAVIAELVTVDKSGNAFSGDFSIDVYDVKGHPLAHVQGLVSATRITAD